MAAIIVLALLGGVLGSAVAGGSVDGFVFGALGGALVASASALSRRVEALERHLASVRRAIEAMAQRAATQPAEPAARPATAAAPHAPPHATLGSSPPRARPDTRPASPSADRGDARVAPRVQFERSPVDQAIELVARWFTTGNVPVKVGVVLSVFGVGFLVKEGIDRHWFVLPVEFRLALAAAFGVALLALGWRLRESQRTYALSVQGGGIAILYLTIYSSFALFHVVPAPVAFALLLVVTAAAGSLAVLQDARSLAVLGIVGGFMAPVLVSTRTDNHVALFSYYAILNLAIVGIAWFKAWRELNVLGFLFTFGIGALWGYKAYTPAHFATTEPFLILFALMYIAIPILFATRVRPELRGFVDGTLVFGTPLVGFGLQSQLVGDTEYGLAISAVALAGLYAATATLILKRGLAELRVLGAAHVALGVVFLTVAVPLALDARWTSVGWALQGAAMVWLGFRQHRRLPLASGVALQLMSGVAYVAALGGVDARPVLNGHLLGAVVIAIAGAFSARLFERPTGEGDTPRHGPQAALALPLAAGVLLLWASGWWLYAGAREIDGFVPHRLELAADLLFLCATTLIALAGAARFAWPRLNHLGLALWLAAIPAAAIASLEVSHPAQNLGWLAWPATLATMGLFLYARERHYGSLRAALHASSYWLAAALVAWETHWLVWQAQPQAARVAFGIWPAAAALGVGAVLVLATVRLLDRIDWPLAANRETYLRFCCGGVLAALVVATLALNAASPGDAAPLPYVPLLNPLELASVLNCVVLLHWLAELGRSAPSLGIEMRHRVTLAALFGLFLLTAAVARTVHHWAGVPFTLVDLTASTVFQTSLSIVWGAAAFAAMLSGARGERRTAWLAGATLMGVVVGKLFLVDLGNSGTLERIVSFLGVGLLLLIVGYFAPVPPRAASGVLGRSNGG